MKKPLLLFLLLTAFQVSFAQTTLKEANNEDCSFVLPWNCETCNFTWTGNCAEGLPSGEGTLIVYNQGDEIMQYNGHMEQGLFHGEGSYRDEMNQLDGTFNRGQFMPPANPYATYRDAVLDTTRFNKSMDWETKTRVTKQIDNLYFIFPASGYAYEHRDEYVDQCLAAIKKNCALIEVEDFKAFTKIDFVNSKKEMLLRAGIFVSGQANLQTKTVNMAVSYEGEDAGEGIVKLPIKHELMHMIAMVKWGMPPFNQSWLNEGLATYAANNCSGYSVSEIYRYFLENDLLLSKEELSQNFYQTEEMIGYHQSGAIVEHLLELYGVEKLESFWKSGFNSFESIYGLSFEEMLVQLNKQIRAKHTKVPSIDLEQFLEGGCR